MPRKPQNHRPSKAAEPQRETRSSTALGYGRTWRKLRAVHLAEHPSCVRCLEQGRATPATVVDHIHPHNGNQELLLEPSNLMSLCASCHSRKTATEDGGFGRAKKEQPRGLPPAEPIKRSWIG